MIEKVKALIQRHRELESLMSSQGVAGDPSQMEKLGREYNTLSKDLPALSHYVQTLQQIAEARHIIHSGQDQDLIELALEELKPAEASLPAQELLIRRMLVPKNPEDAKNAIMEIRAGTGGVEAGIFGADLYRMYMHFIANKGWKTEVLDSSYGDLDSLKEIVFSVEGDGAYGTLKFESGVHRVQRVPLTEAQGRIHTSAASVVVLPEADEVEASIDPEDLRIDVFRAGGKGGQHVNKTESAVRIVHLPTGLVATCQDEKSQHKNKAKAMKVLQSRLYELRLQEKDTKESETRRSMVGSGDRSEKIRTYNFPQNRVTDHRINFSIHKLDAVMNGELRQLLDALVEADIAERIRTIDTHPTA